MLLQRRVGVVVADLRGEHRGGQPQRDTAEDAQHETGTKATTSSAGTSAWRSSARNRGTNRTRPAPTPKDRNVCSTMKIAVALKNWPAVVVVRPWVRTRVRTKPRIEPAPVPSTAKLPPRATPASGLAAGWAALATLTAAGGSG